MKKRNGPTSKARRPNGQSLPPMLHSPIAEAYHQRFLYLFDEALGKLLRDNPDVERRVNVLSAEIFEILAEGLRKRASASAR